MITYFRELLSEIKKIRMELEKVRESVERTEEQLRKISGTNNNGGGYVRTGGMHI